jgi:hypothetical protein
MISDPLEVFPPCEKYVRKTVGAGVSESPEVLSELSDSVQNSLYTYQDVLEELSLLSKYDKDVEKVCSRVLTLEFEYEKSRSYYVGICNTLSMVHKELVP